MSEYSRRRFLKHAGTVSVGFLGLRQLLESEGWTQAADAATTNTPNATPMATPTPTSTPVSRASLAQGYGDLIKDPRGLIDLPRGFSYHAFSHTGETMSDGLLVPGMHDGMAAFRGPKGRTILVRNHEMQAEWGGGPFGEGNKMLSKVDKTKFYDHGQGKNPQLGGTTTLVYDTKKRVLESHFLSLAGTCRNCAGGPTPWNTWITCEETVMPANFLSGGTTERDHGYNFEVPASAKIGLAAPVALKAMGRFMHEAVAVDARSGIVYQTEDRDDGLIYRFIPTEKASSRWADACRC
jgi:secreted PhoX family phosphatase